MRFFIEREQVKKQIIQNLREAGDTITKDGYDITPDLPGVLNALDPKDLLAVLLESHQLKEQKQIGNPISAYPIDFLRIGDN